ncbi:MAG: DUF1015 domain-containing protein [Desulfomonilaceae bacterium]|nr:DUF1015 domain-containing protein [Desulfomonilaceae bacterium]
MADIQPFRMVQYNGKSAGELDRLITPPYDVISEAQQQAFYDAHPRNIIRLVLGKQFPEDNDRDNKYTRAAATLKQWLTDGTLVRKDSPGMTVYRMDFEDPQGGRRRLDGIVALVKVDEYGKGKVLPHEKTYLGPKADQLNIMRHCGANITPIHGLFNDDDDAVTNEYRRVMQAPPEQHTTDADGTLHQTWTLNDEEVVSRIVSSLKDKSIFIADGHHRYETALAYRNEVRSAGQSATNGNADYVMMYLTALAHPGLTILPAHRMVKGLNEVEVPLILKKLEPYFHSEELCFRDGNREEVSQRLVERIASYSNIGGKFGMVVRGELCFQLLRLKDFDAVKPLMDPTIPEDLKGLDVTILREIIIGHGLGLDRDNPEGHIEYTPSISEALHKAIGGEVQVSFILNPTRVDQMRAAAELGHKLPHKSTYFFPKLSSGLVLNVF